MTMPNESPETIVVTGATRGIGRGVARALAAQGHRIVLTGRDPSAGAEALAEVRAAGSPDPALVLFDMSSLRSVREGAQKLVEVCPRIDVFVHNAGLWPTRREIGDDGLERAFVVNHLAPFLLNHLLEPQLVKSRTRVVQVSAGLYIKGVVDLERTPKGEDFHAIRTYCTTKLLGLMTMPRFAAKWAASGVCVDAVHPGVIRTNLGDRTGALGVLLRLVKRLWRTVDQGAEPVVRLVNERPEPAKAGRYFHELVEQPLAPVATNAEVASRVWDQAVALAGLESTQRPASA
ncbi:MAG: SDR family NAD(P)-dependent oxidoreductase [Polyangiaceae bacterium]|nr:SDR family NAD(P)-dependent oxidoreductase [Polyangiaceae bacterium]